MALENVSEDEDINRAWESIKENIKTSATERIKIYRTIILPEVLYGCETWSLTLREECRLRVFENRVLRKVYGPKRERT